MLRSCRRYATRLPANESGKKPLGLLDRSAHVIHGVILGLALLVSAGTTGAEAASITTLFNPNWYGSDGGAVYFDLIVGPNDISITGLNSNTDAAGTFPGFQVYTGVGTAFGNETNAGFWTLAGSGTLNAVGLNGFNYVALGSNIDLSANTSYGIALVMPADAAHHFTITGELGALASYANMDLTLNFGTATNLPFNDDIWYTRTWNGTIYYNTVRVVPLPAAAWLLLSAIGALSLFGWRRRQGAT